MPNPDFWTIKTINDVHGPGPNKSNLVGCKLTTVTDVLGTHYQFQGPGGPGQGGAINTAGSTLPALPFTFPVFNAPLGGPNALNWYIGVTSLTGGRHGTDAEGTYSNNPPPSFRPEPGGSGADDDTWTAQAGHGIGDDLEKEKEKDKESAASASPKM